MRRSIASIRALLLAGALSSPAAASGFTITGVVVDPVVVACGVRIEARPPVRVRPFLEADPRLLGRYRMEIRAQSHAGRTVTRQDGVLRDATLDAEALIGDAHALHLLFTVTDGEGAVLCSVDEHVDLAARRSSVLAERSK